MRYYFRKLRTKSKIFWSSIIGKIYARHETTPEEKITGIVETIDNPFDNEIHVTKLGNKINKNSREKERQKILNRIEDENDEDIREALRHGNTVEIIKDSINY